MKRTRGICGGLGLVNYESEDKEGIPGSLYRAKLLGDSDRESSCGLRNLQLITRYDT